MTQRYIKDLKPGDLISVCYNNRHWVGIFKKFTDKSTQFYPFWYQEYYNICEKDGKIPRVTYVNRTGDNIFVKVNPLDMGDEEYDKYIEVKNLIIKNNWL